MVKALIFAAILALTACQTASGNFCDLNKPIRLSSVSVDALSDDEVRQILAHNTKGQKLCRWKP